MRTQAEHRAARAALYAPDRGRWRRPGRKLFAFRLAGQPYSLFRWERRARHGRYVGYVLRVGPLGHLQAQLYGNRLVGREADGRRRKHGLNLSAWGVKGRRRKRAVEFAVHL